MPYRNFFGWTMAISLMLSSPVAAKEKKGIFYPMTKTENVVETIQGVEVSDPYRWLEKADDPEVKEWVDKQNAITRSVLDNLPGRDKIRRRLDSLLEIGAIGTPAPARGHYFYTKRDGAQNQAVLFVREGLRGKDR